MISRLYRLSALFVFCIFSLNAYTQYTITCDFPELAGQYIRLTGFAGFGTYAIDSAKVSEKGTFVLKYSGDDRGMGYLAAEDDKAYVIVIAGEGIKLKGGLLSIPESVSILAGEENLLFDQYLHEHPIREQALSAWIYLRRIYREDPLFNDEKETALAVEKEINKIKNQDHYFLSSLDTRSYISWYLPVRKLVSSVSVIAQYRTEEIPGTIEAFRNLDYLDERLYRSGLLKDVIESHYWLIENMGKSLDSVFIEMNISTDRLLSSISSNEAAFNEITKFLFNLLEQRSLFTAAEYLSVKSLTQNSCTLENNLANQLESYRAMKKGNVVPDIVFSGDVFKNGAAAGTPGRLYEIESPYKVVIFGASWCPKCAEEFSYIPPLYEKWKSKGVEVVFISLDTDPALFKSFTKIFGFISMCDYKKWDTQAAKDYYIFATPTMFLLDKDNRIILRPGSVRQIDGWIDFYSGEK